jgi:signal transduction histidine kinase
VRHGVQKEDILVNFAFIAGLILLIVPDVFFYPAFTNTLRYWANIAETLADGILFSTAFLFLKKEIRRRRTINERLTEANRDKTKLLQIASHDLRNPLNAILLLASQPSSPDEPDANERIASLGHEMLGIIEELIDAAACKDGILHLNRTPLDLTACVADVVERNRAQAQRKDQQIHFTKDDPVMVEADSARIRQAIDNLVSNAIKFSPPGESIFVCIHCEDENAKIEVIDHGPGFNAEDRKKLFGEFQRLSARPTGGESSIGLGLANARSLVELNGGKIGAESDGPGRGSRFWIELPVAHVRETDNSLKPRHIGVA